MILLMLLYCVSYTDRMVLSLLAAPVSEALNISDTQLGVLFGTGFGVVYALVGLPLAHFVDRS
ncbi:MAG: MFS transporter, partial [Hyphomonadaceae bacterium]|nr:MFS transporter [Hyphomonadaceae bacterium]